MEKDSKNQKNPKKPKKKSFMDTVREVDEQDRVEREALKEKYKKIEEEQREKHGKDLNKDKIELLKSKQGITENKFEEEKDKKKKSSIKSKTGSFFYLNKWWLILVILAAALVTFLTVQLFTRPRPDIKILLITDDDVLQNNADKIEKYFEKYIDDYNHNGKIEAAVYTLPINQNEIDYDYVKGHASGLNTQLQMGEAVIVISDKTADEYIDADNILLDLKKEFPNDKDVKKHGIYLKNTNFMKDIGLGNEKINSDVHIGIREVKDQYNFKKKMQKTFNKDYPVLEKIVNDLEAGR